MEDLVTKYTWKQENKVLLLVSKSEWSYWQAVDKTEEEMHVDLDKLSRHCGV